ncbi:energy transducer TonB [Mangrovibacterium sp.]|uniref:energy transducer TonB n=1 Tax=Mangrovibacterium sp. TaxID=1961364 RepID=UPI0035641AF6
MKLFINRILILVIFFQVAFNLVVLSQSMMDNDGNTINQVVENKKIGKWILYSEGDTQIPNGKRTLECIHSNDTLNGAIEIRENGKLILKIGKVDNNSKIEFTAFKGSKTIEGYFQKKGSKVKIFNLSGTEMTSKSRDWVAAKTEFIPLYYNGIEELHRDIKSLLSCDNVKGAKGTIYVGFTVDTNGYVKNPEVFKAINTTGESQYLLEKEALRTVMLLPRFQPGFQSYRFVNTKFRIPITFE